MTERWQRELKKLGGVDVPAARIRARMSERTGERPVRVIPAGSPRQRVIAGLVAFGVFAVAGIFAYRTLSPIGGPAHSSTGRRHTLPELTLRVPGVGAETSSPGDPGFSLGLIFGDIHLSLPPTQGDTGPSPAGPAFIAKPPPLDLALTSGSTLRLISAAGSTRITLGPPSDTGGPWYSLRDGSTVPAPGDYRLQIDATWPNSTGWATWIYAVSVVPGGTMQLWAPPVPKVGDGAESTPNVDLVVDGRWVGPGAANASAPTGSIADRYPDLTTALEVMQGARVAIDLTVSRRVGDITWVAGRAPHAFLGAVDRSVRVPSFDAVPGEYYLSVYVRMSQFTGDLVYPVKVLPATAAPSPAPSEPSGRVVHVAINTTSGAPNCPGAPEAELSYANETIKGLGTSFTWTCPGSGMAADSTSPSFGDADFVRVPAGASLQVSGDFTAAEGELQYFHGDYPWATVSDLSGLMTGADLSLIEPGLYVLQVTAHWSNGDRQLYFPIDLLAPNVLKVICDRHVTGERDTAVALQPDGLHIQIVDSPSTGERVALFAQNLGGLPGDPLFDTEGHPGEAVAPLGIGIYHVLCHEADFGLGNPPDEAKMNTVYVVDDKGNYVPPS